MLIDVIYLLSPPDAKILVMYWATITTALAAQDPDCRHKCTCIQMSQKRFDVAFYRLPKCLLTNINTSKSRSKGTVGNPIEAAVCGMPSLQNRSLL